MRLIHVGFWLLIGLAIVAMSKVHGGEDVGGGLIVPDNLEALAESQNAKAAPVVRAYLEGRAASGRRAGPTADMAAWDWRATGMASPVVSQGGCGSCYGCATAGTIEGSAMALGGRTISVSVQHIISKSNGCRGGWWEFEAAKKGFASTEDCPYLGRPSNTAGVPISFQIMTWGYVDARGGCPSIEALKDHLCKFGPLAIGIVSDRALQNLRKGEVWTGPRGKVNHAVVLYGWDDVKRVWIIRNSWGKDFCDGGYFLASYDGFIGYGAAYCVTMPSWFGDDARSAMLAACDACNAASAVDGPATAETSSLVVLRARDGKGKGWTFTPSSGVSSRAVVTDGGQSLVFATPGSAGLFEFGLIVQDGERYRVEWHTVKVGSVSPVPPVPPTPPVPPVVPLNEFGSRVSGYWQEVEAETRQRLTAKLSAAYDDVATRIDAGKAASAAEAFALFRAAGSEVVKGDDRKALQPFTDRLTTEWLEAVDAGKLATMEVIVLAIRQIALGIRQDAARSDEKADSDNRAACESGACETQRRTVLRWR